jgi:mono/diheme cytochrome c family protein
MARLIYQSAVALVIGCVSVTAAEPAAPSRFHKEIQPLLEQYCWDCHGDGMDKGNVTFDGFKSEKEALEKRELWLAALKNVRAGIMPPAKKPRVAPADLKKLETWIKHEAFGIDPMNPDPGRVTIRRLNRVEYRNTIRDLMGIDFKADDEFPPDDTGYGFDNIGDVLTISPLLLEKYMQAAEAIVATAVPTNALVLPEKTFPGSQFRDGETKGEALDIYKPATLKETFKADADGDYRVLIDVTVSGHFDFDPGRCALTFSVDGQERVSKELGWEAGKKFSFELPEKWKAGEHELQFELKPLTPAEEKKTYINLRIESVRVQGPLDKKHWTRPKNFDRFFTQEEPKKPAARRTYAQQILSKFAMKAYRRPVDQRTVDKLVSIAEDTYGRPGKTFQEGIGRAITAVLASPRFLFRVEEPEKSTAKERYPLVDEFSLASRLSYFLWSTTPDDELLHLAERGELRKNLTAQVKRMLADRKADELVQNFTGQWLQTRDVEGIDINARVILFRDSPGDPDFRQKRQRREELRDKRDKSKLTPEEHRELDQLQEEFFRRFRNRPNIELDGELRRAMRRETEMAFGHIMREDRSILELLDADYTFLNERLARHYALTNLDIKGPEMRRVTLPDESPRGGVLTHGSMLIVTSNPTRTSPVKRGLFVLENILGTPPPPPPADVPDLEEAAKEFKDREPTLREMLELHRSKPLCSSCHSRMDPIGLALENFNALGMWRDTERRQPIDTKGKLITGESFNGINELKRILINERRVDYYRCLTEKLLTYALGRGLEDYDMHTLDQIVDRLEADKGRFSALLMGLIESSPFQKRRNSAVLAESTGRE